MTSLSWTDWAIITITMIRYIYMYIKEEVTAFSWVEEKKNSNVSLFMLQGKEQSSRDVGTDWSFTGNQDK